MPINRVAFVLLGIICVAAAGGGAYLATRQNQAASSEVQGSVQSQPVAATPATVTETETIVDEVPKVSDLPKAEIAPATKVAAIAAPKPGSSRESARRQPAPARVAPRPA